MKEWKEYIISNKSLFFDVLCIIVGIIGLFWLVFNFTMNEIYQRVLDWNLSMELSSHWYVLFIVYLVEIMLLMVIWDLFWFQLEKVFYHLYDEISNNAVEKKRVRLLVKLVRIKYGFYKVYHYVRIGWVSNSNRQSKKMIDFIISATIFDLVRKIWSMIFKLPVIFSSILTLIARYKIDIMQLVVFQRIWDEKASLLWEHFTKLSAVVVAVLLIFIWYFVSSKGVIRRSIAQANRKRIEGVIEMHRKFPSLIINVIKTGSENIEYIIKNRDLISDYWMAKRYPFLFEKGTDKKFIINKYSKQFDEFLVKEIPEINECIQGIEELFSSGNRSVARYVATYNYDLLVFYSQIGLRKVEHFEQIMFTKVGLERMVNPKIHDQDKGIRHRGKDEEDIKQDLEFFKRYVLNFYIIEGVEQIYLLYRYVIFIDKMLQVDSDKLDRTLRVLTGKE
ncbi:hypothetical protein [Bacillus toyonensis]|uniref:Uncharacterized protein n=1 Tax=Bacillus toyonensis TaxID=155322 RepID=A0AB36SQR4_9BACI|nr:hypothetical protein [Bacillus toyonensis]PEK15727.1 hypothetical protein CN683_15045 [Bacillus toyonensis]PEN55856.1 hypothetical protein CN596_07915 [Bacillus toyonensis]PGC83591.1 hypothetical protein COM29_21720 [Bacillus toyonensis]PHA11263.1 hypothetical protein COE66_19550 [Bacillus toyonensis]